MDLLLLLLVKKKLGADVNAIRRAASVFCRNMTKVLGEQKHEK